MKLPFPRGSLRFKMVLWYSAVLLATLFVFRIATYQVIRNSLYADFDASLHAEVAWMHQLLDAYRGRGVPDAEIRSEIAERSGLSPRKEFVEVFDRSGALYFRSENLFGETLAGLHPDPFTEAVSIAGFQDYGIRLYATRTPEAEIYVGYPLEDIENAIGDVGSSFLFLIPLALALAVLGGFFLVTRFLGPVRELDNYAEAIVATPLDRALPLPTVRQDEIGQLMRHFHSMVETMRAGSRRALSFAALASHELRNPLAILRSDLERVMASPEPDGHEAAVASAYDEVLRLSGVVDGLLTLGTLEAKTFRLDRAPREIGAFLEGFAEEAVVLAEARGVVLESRGNGGAVVNMDETMLRQALFNLLDNALKHSPQGGRVRIAWSREGDHVVITIRDDGKGIPARDLPRVFDFFYRADDGGGARGAGLGLPLARRVVEAHGGDLRLESRLGEGTTVTMRLPAAALPR